MPCTNSACRLKKQKVRVLGASRFSMPKNGLSAGPVKMNLVMKILKAFIFQARLTAFCPAITVMLQQLTTKVLQAPFQTTRFQLFRQIFLNLKNFRWKIFRCLFMLPCGIKTMPEQKFQRSVFFPSRTKLFHRF